MNFDYKFSIIFDSIYSKGIISDWMYAAYATLVLILIYKRDGPKGYRIMNNVFAYTHLQVSFVGNGAMISNNMFQD